MGRVQGIEGILGVSDLEKLQEEEGRKATGVGSADVTLELSSYGCF